MPSFPVPVGQHHRKALQVSSKGVENGHVACCNTDPSPSFLCSIVPFPVTLLLLQFSHCFLLSCTLPLTMDSLASCTSDSPLLLQTLNVYKAPPFGLLPSLIICILHFLITFYSQSTFYSTITFLSSSSFSSSSGISSFLYLFSSLLESFFPPSA